MSFQMKEYVSDSLVHPWYLVPIPTFKPSSESALVLLRIALNVRKFLVHWAWGCPSGGGRWISPLSLLHITPMFARLSWYSEICLSRKEIMNLQSLTRQNLVRKLEIRDRAGRGCRPKNWLQRIYCLSYFVQRDRWVSSNLKSLLTTSNLTIWSQVSFDLGFAVRSEYLWLKSISRICSTPPKCSSSLEQWESPLGKLRVNVSPQHGLAAHRTQLPKDFGTLRISSNWTMALRDRNSVAYRTHCPKRCRNHNLASVWYLTSEALWNQRFRCTSQPLSEAMQ
jgi:hypothetical protein